MPPRAADRETGGRASEALRAHADRERRPDRRRSARRCVSDTASRLDGRRRDPGDHPDAGARQVGLDDGRAISASSGGSTWSASLHDRHGEAPAAQVLGQLEADEAAADDDRRRGLLRSRRAAAMMRVHVLEVAQGERALDAGDGGPQRAGAGGEHQRVVPLLGAPTGGPVAHGDEPGGRGRSRPPRDRTRTSSAKRAASDSGVCSSRLARSSMTPPTWYGSPQLANDT